MKQHKISTERIDKIVEAYFELSLQAKEMLLEQFEKEQYDYLQYIMQQEFELLGDNEHELLLDNALTIWHIFKTEFDSVSSVHAEAIDDAQDNNWADVEQLPSQKAQRFDDYVEPMIATYPQDELLYFILDTMQDDEEDEEFNINRESKLPIFIALKSFIDVMIGN